MLPQGSPPFASYHPTWSGQKNIEINVQMRMRTKQNLIKHFDDHKGTFRVIICPIWLPMTNVQFSWSPMQSLHVKKKTKGMPQIRAKKSLATPGLSPFKVHWDSIFDHRHSHAIAACLCRIWFKSCRIFACLQYVINNDCWEKMHNGTTVGKMRRRVCANFQAGKAKFLLLYV